MNRHAFTFALLSFVGGWLCWGPVLRGEPFQVAPKEGILVLRNGGIVRGVITRAGSEYYVGVKAGEIRLKVDEVELACADLDEAYRMKSAGLPTGHASEHATLAEWCLRQGLLGYAAKELLAARAADSKYPKLELLERRLNLAMHPVEPYSASAPKLVDKGEPDKQTEAEQVVNRLPPQLVESYTNVIQPLLVNGCAAAACHGNTSSNKLRLERIAVGRSTSSRISQRNLASVLTCVDLENAAQSPLLTLPLGAHGTAAEAVLTDRDVDKYRQLVAWVTAVTLHMAPAAPNNVTVPTGPLLQTISGPRKAYGVRVRPTSNNTQPDKLKPETTVGSPIPPDRDLESDDPQKPEFTELPTIQLDGSEAEKASPFEPSRPGNATPAALPTPAASMREAQLRQGHKFGAPQQEPASQDPFDPEIFNREFGSQ